MKKIFAYSIGSVSLLTPVITFAATNMTLVDIIRKVTYYLNEVLLLLMGVAIVMFVFYIIKYFFRPDADRKEAGMYVMYAVIGFFVILSFWGIVNILQNTFGLQNSQNAPSSWSEFGDIFPSR